MSAPPYGFRVVGSAANERQPVDHASAFLAHCQCDPRAEVDRESYLSAFTFDEAFLRYMAENGSTRGYQGPCGAPWLWWDIDRPGDFGRALSDCRRLLGVTLDRYRDLDDEAPLVFFSGAKGMHLGLPVIWPTEPSPKFHLIAKHVLLKLADAAGVQVDPGIYDRVRLLRAPNSKHPRTRLYKRRLTVEELNLLKPEAVLKLAETPQAFEVRWPREASPTAEADWQESAHAVLSVPERRPRSQGEVPKLNALTFAFVREGALEGDRHRQLFSAAANLAEFDCPGPLAHALLTEPALDSGLAPRDVHRQIECGLEHVRRQREGGAA